MRPFAVVWSMLFASLIPHLALAGGLSFASDLIGDSRPGAQTTHTITFTAENAIPPSGSFTIVPEGGGGGTFTIPATMDASDIVLSVSSGGGPFNARALATLPSAVSDGVSIVSGSAGSFAFTLASGLPGIGAGDTVRVTIGNARMISLPLVEQSYRIRLRSFDAASTPLDTGTTMIAVTPGVDVSGVIEIILPTRSNGLPSGLLPGATTQVLVSLNTDIPATCKYASTSGVGYSAMATSTTFNSANVGTLHYFVETVTENNIYNHYVRCAVENGSANPDDYLISFEVGVIPNASTTPPPPPPPPTPSGPSGGGGGGGNFLKGGDVTISGSGIPGAALVILKDGKITKESQTDFSGSFTEQFTSLDRGTYTWGVYLKDPDGNLSSTYNSTIYLVGGTNNIIAPVYLSPTIKAASTTVGLGSTVALSGYAIPISTVQVIMNKQGDPLNSKIVSATTTANGNGSWKLSLPTDGLAKGTYEVKAQSLIGKKDQSVFSPTLYIGIGQNPNPNFKNRADLNRDGKVNLIDFSILLFNWKTADSTADINLDGTVNLTDFSIMLANWTG
jgi:hypothetical protein